MIDTKELRRLAQEATPGPWKMLPVGDGRQKFAVADRKSLSILTVTDEGEATFGTVYDDADAKFIAAANPATINDLLDRLEAAEKAVNEAYQRGYETGQEEIEKERDALRGDRTTLQQMVYSLKDRVEVVEKEYQHVLEVKEIYQHQLNETEDERDALRAKIEQMERQEPVGTLYDDGCFVWRNGRPPESNYAEWKMPLYTLPGAKGEEK